MIRFLLPILWAISCAQAESAGVVAYVSGTEQEDQRVVVQQVDATTVTPVGPGRADGAPQWSPDGRLLAFESRPEDGVGIYVVAADGTSGKFLPHQFSWNQDPRWSDDGCRKLVCKGGICGRYLLYSGGGGEGLDHQLVVYDTVEARETVWAGGQRGMMRPVWLPNTRLMQALAPEQRVIAGLDLVALQKELNAPGTALSVGITGTPGKLSTELYLVTHGHAAPLLPLVFLALSMGAEDSSRYEEWNVTPNIKADRIAFESNDGGDREIYIIGKKGLTNITNHRAADWNPVWSPRSRLIAFESFRGGRRGIYRVFPETARVEEVAANAAYDCWAPTWSPDEEQIAYVSDQSGDPEIYICSAGGGNARPLTAHPGIDYAPAWQPRPGS